MLIKVSLKGHIDKMIVIIIIFFNPLNMSVDTKIAILQVSDDEIQDKIVENGGHFQFMQIRSDGMIQWRNDCYQHIPWPWKHGGRHQNLTPTSLSWWDIG